VFTDATATQMPADNDGTLSVALGDVDSDLDLDLACGNSGQDRLLTNLQRQLHAPHLLRSGQPYFLEAYSRYGQPSVSDVALTYLSTTRVSIPVPPFGVLGIGNPMAPLPPVLIPQPAGVAVLTCNVPNAPALAGIHLYAQALLVTTAPFGVRLSNTTDDVLVR
jgi:hypothetical protein